MLYFLYLMMLDDSWYECDVFVVNDFVVRKYGFSVIVFRGMIVIVRLYKIYLF